jgi:poly(3-hydroxybutyrate) depolymerase
MKAPTSSICHLVICVLVVIGATCTAVTASTQGTLSRNVKTSWNGSTRYYDLYVPRFLAARPVLWVMLHPTVNSEEMPTPFDQEPLIALADANGFIILWPISTYNSDMWYWDAYFLDYSFGSNPEDSGYIRSLILNFESVYPISDVFVAGMSSGAFMAHRVAIDSADLVSAIGAASGQVYAEDSANTVPLPVRPVSVIMLNGDEDKRVGYCGSDHDWGDSDTPASDVTLDYWADAAGYTGKLPQLCTDGNPTSGVTEAVVQDSGVTVKFVREVGVGHTWVPGTEGVMWKFFQENARSPISSVRQ